jgi:KDO2-lipid IV(A) lauroyltransferase
MSDKSSRPVKSGDHSTEIPSAVLNGFARFVQSLSHRRALKFGESVGSLLRLVLRSKTRITRDNLVQAFPDLANTPELALLEKKIFRHFGRVGVEFLRFPLMDSEWLRSNVSVEGIEHVFERLRAGRGVLVISAHFGNWEFAIKRLSIDLPKQIHVVIRRIKDPNVHEFIRTYREKFGGGVSIVQDNGALPILRVLKKNGIVVTVLDQNAGSTDGIFSPFFGRPAATYSSVARIAYHLDIPVLPVFDVELEDGKHRINIGSPLTADRRSENEFTQSLTDRCNETLEKMIRLYPEQWIWMHNRWKTKKPDLS